MSQAGINSIVSQSGIVFSAQGIAPIQVNGVSGVPESGNITISITAPYSPTTFTSDGILYGNGTGPILATSSVNDGVLITSNTGVPSLLPNSGTAGFVLTANAGAPPSWQAGGGGAGFNSINVQTFTSSGTYTPTAGMAYAIVEIVGGGGAGGGAAATAGGQASVGGGGGSGEIARSVFSSATLGASQAVTIGSAGSSNSGAAGGNGGNSSLGSLISANGGIGGPTLASTNFGAAQGGLGGSGGTGGTFDSPGQNGTNGFANPGAIIAWSGAGASSPYGSGGEGITNGNLTLAAVNLPGNNALGFGSGGGGGLNGPSNSATVGGAGTAGYVLITEYIG